MSDDLASGDYRNARDELLEHIGKKHVVAARVVICMDNDADQDDGDGGDNGGDQLNANSADDCGQRVATLYGDYTAEELQAFLAMLDFKYDCGYGHQFISGTIWYADGNWSARQEYDGSEWWQLHRRPPMPRRPTGNDAAQ